MRYLWYNLFIAQNKKTVQRRRKCRRYPVMVWKYENRISQSARHWKSIVRRSAIWRKSMNRCGQNWKWSRKQRNVLTRQSIWFIQRKRTMPTLVLTSVFRRCLLISGELPSSMHWEVYRPMKAGWNSGRQRENSPGNRILPVKTMPCRSFTGMWCTAKGQREKMRHTWNCMTGMTGDGFVCV